MVQSILYVWLVSAFRVMRRQFYRAQIVVRTGNKEEEKKEGLQKQIQMTPTYISEKIVFKAAFSLNSQGVAKLSLRKESWKEITCPDTDIFFLLVFSFLTRRYSGQLRKRNCRDATHWVVSSIERKRKNKLIGSLSSFRQGPGVVITIIISSKLISDFSPFGSDASDLNLLWCFSVPTGWEVVSTVYLRSTHQLHCVTKTDFRFRRFIFLFLFLSTPVQALVVLGWRWHNLWSAEGSSFNNRSGLS